MSNPFIVATETSQFFFMPTSASVFVFMILYLMLFWRRKAINSLVFFHVLFVATVFSGSWLISDMFLLVKEIQQNQVSEAIFVSNISIVKNLILPFLCLWIYQLWVINRESSKIDFLN